MRTAEVAHTALAWAVVISNGIAGGWALVALQAHRLDAKPLWWFTGFAYVLVFVQIVAGVVLLQTSEIEAPAFHVFYGVCAALSVAVLYGYRHQLKNKRLLLFGLGSLFIMGLSIRAMFLGS